MMIGPIATATPNKSLNNKEHSEHHDEGAGDNRERNDNQIPS